MRVAGKNIVSYLVAKRNMPGDDGIYVWGDGTDKRSVDIIMEDGDVHLSNKLAQMALESCFGTTSTTTKITSEGLSESELAVLRVIVPQIDSFRTLVGEIGNKPDIGYWAGRKDINLDCIADDKKCPKSDLAAKQQKE